MKIPRISKPEEFVEITFTDCGDVKAIYDKDRPAHDGYTSKFELDGKTLKSCTYRSAVLKSGNPQKFRYEQDCEFLKKHDLDLERAIFE